MVRQEASPWMAYGTGMRSPVVLGKYELVEPLATGGMAELFLATAVGPAGVHKTVVIKQIRPEHMQDPRFVNLFINEARIGMMLTHPNIVQVYDLGRARGSWYIAMEYVHGKDLMRVFRRGRAVDERIPSELAVYLVAELLRGLHHAHTRTANDGRALQLVHHDVSPHNVLIGFDGHVKLVDFGIARIQKEGTPVAGDSGTPAGRGKLAYRSPESAESGADHRVDVYAAGVVLWEALAGERPYAGLPHAERLQRLREDGIPALPAHVPAELAAIVARACATDPAERHASAARFEEDLRAWLYEVDARAGSEQLAELMRSLFPDERSRVQTIDTASLVDDLERLETEAAPTPSPRPELPGRLQHSPGERKQVAVLVVDVDGLTDLSAELEPEQFVARHFRLLRWVRRIVDRWGGILQRAIDDHLVILFGVPRTREDDLSRAMDCALDLVARCPELRAKGLTLEFCIGIHAGEVTVGMVRRRVNYLARGNTTRLARRLSAAADHAEILVSQRVLTQMEAAFRLRQGPHIASRGGDSPLNSYRLESRRAGVRLAQQGPWLVRGKEVEQLRGALERLAAGKGSALGLVGPVGAGKSRLIREVEHLALRRAIPFRRVRCARFGAGHALGQLVESLLSIEDGRTEEALARLDTTPQNRHALRYLLGLPGRPAERNDIRRALVELMRQLTLEGPVILALETEGMEDADLLTLLAVIEGCRELPLFYILASRPPVPARLAEVVERVELGPFPIEALRKMLTSLLEVDVLDQKLVDLVARTCEGNPLYLEEMAKFLLERGQLVVENRCARLEDGELELPDSLHGLISARIDALDAASKGVLQLASVIGELFSSELLGIAAGLEDPTPLLIELEATGLVVRSGEQWAFASQLVREAAARGILGVQRRDYHRLVSEAIEQLHRDELEGHVEELAEHCARGSRWIDAVRYSLRAGDRHEASGHLEQARRWYERGLRHVGHITDPDDHDARVQGEAVLNLKIGAVSLLLGEVGRGRGCLSLALDIAGDAGLPWIENRAHLRIATSFLHEGRTKLAAAHLGQAVALSADEPEVELEALEASATVALEEGRHEDAERVWQQVLARAEGAPRLTARCLTGLATQFMQMGDHGRAQPMLEQALKAARAAGDRLLEGRVLNNIGLQHSIQGHHREALDWYQRALDAREGTGYTRGVAINHHNIGDAYFHLEQWPRAHVAFHRSRELAEQTGWVQGTALNSSFLAYLETLRNPASLDDAVQSLREATPDLQIELTRAWLLGRLLVERGRSEEGGQVLQQALERAEALHQAPEAARIRDTLARVTGAGRPGTPG